MRRLLSRVAVVVLVVAVGSAALLEAQSTGINDQEVQGFVLPGTSTKASRVHANRSHMSLALPYGNIIAQGGYKIAYVYAHPNNIRASLSNSAMTIAGTGSERDNNSASGVYYQRPPYAGSIIGISAGASTALTAGSVTLEATVLRKGLTPVVGTGLTTVLSSAAAVQYNANAQPRNHYLSTFYPGDLIGCRLTSSGDLAPATAEIACTLVVEH